MKPKINSLIHAMFLHIFCFPELGEDSIMVIIGIITDSQHNEHKHVFQKKSPINAFHDF